LIQRLLSVNFTIRHSAEVILSSESVPFIGARIDHYAPVLTASSGTHHAIASPTGNGNRNFYTLGTLGGSSFDSRLPPLRTRLTPQGNFCG